MLKERENLAVTTTQRTIPANLLEIAKLMHENTGAKIRKIFDCIAALYKGKFGQAPIWTAEVL